MADYQPTKSLVLLSIALRVVDIYRRDGNKLAENWIFIDLLYFLKQQRLDVLERNRRLLTAGKGK